MKVHFKYLITVEADLDVTPDNYPGTEDMSNIDDVLQLVHDIEMEHGPQTAIELVEFMPPETVKMEMTLQLNVVPDA